MEVAGGAAGGERHGPGSIRAPPPAGAVHAAAPNPAQSWSTDLPAWRTGPGA